jgi:TldD protein
MEDELRRLVDRALSLGASYAEARYQVDSERVIRVRNGSLERVSTDSTEGFSVRVLYNGAWGFASGPTPSVELAETAFKAARAASALVGRRVSLAPSELTSLRYEVVEGVRLSDVQAEEAVKYLMDLDKDINIDKRIGVRMLSMDMMETRKTIVNSEGALVESRVPRLELFSVMMAHDPSRGLSQQRSEQYGGSGGWELTKNLRIDEDLKRNAETLVKILDTARPIKSEERLDVVFSPELAGIFVHESVGHPSELDRIMGREGAEAGESYMKVNDLGNLRIGSEHVTIIDDPTIPHSYGYYLVDEEGVRARPRVLVNRGVVNEFLMNREYASYIGRSSNAAARASEFNREPIPRMANTYLAPGDWRPEELIRETRNGLYFVSYQEWNIDDRRWFGRYGGLEAYRIVNGELGEMVLMPYVELTTRTLWSSVDAVANDLSFNAGTCGKGNPMQGVPVWFGGVTFRAKNLLVKPPVLGQ